MRRVGTATFMVKRREWEVIDKRTHKVLKIVTGAKTNDDVLVEQKGVLRIGKKTADGVELRDGNPSYDAKIIGKLE